MLPSGEPALSPAAADACARLVEALPEEVDPGVTRREVPSDPTRYAAWGDPAVVLTCGAVLGDPAEAPLGVNGVSWVVRDTGAGFRFTTRDLPVTVAVDVPDAYPNGAELVNPLAAPVLEVLGPPAPSPSS